MTREPYELDPPPRSYDAEAMRRYQRGRRLAQFAHELRSWERAGLIDHPRYVRRVAYRRHCLANWQAYLDGDIAPPTGRPPSPVPGTRRGARKDKERTMQTWTDHEIAQQTDLFFYTDGKEFEPVLTNEGRIWFQERESGLPLLGRDEDGETVLVTIPAA